MESITIVGSDFYLGMDVFNLNQTLYLVKDLDNKYDSDAIKVVLEGGVQVGYVANSVYTVARGTSSAGRIYNGVEDYQKVVVSFIIKNVVIANMMEDTID
ncbi:MAG: HIRAN domain-containing protein [Erysipelotrichaceae bacterium]